MHKQLEDYLAQVEKALRPLPAVRRAEEMKEMRQHLLSAVDFGQREGQSENEAVADALRQFGGHQELGKRVVAVWRRERWRRMGEAPELTAFAVFSSMMTLFSLWFNFAGPMRWREAAYPYIGGSLSTPYMFCLIFAWPAIFGAKDAIKSRLALIQGPVLILLLYAAFGAEEYLRIRRLPDFHNPYFSVHDPYMTASPWQPVWTVALPLIWALVIGGGQALRSYKTRQGAS